MLTIVLVEDNPDAADLLQEYLCCDDLNILATYHSAEETLDKVCEDNLPDVVLMDIGLPGMSGIELAQKLKLEFPSIEIVMQTIFEDPESILAAIRAGASGYVLKASLKEDVVAALEEVKRGGSFLSGRVARKILEEVQSNGNGETPSGAFDLTPRENEILRELVRGKSYKEIAALLEVSIHTVNNHTRKIYEKMRVNSRGEAVAKAHGLE